MTYLHGHSFSDGTISLLTLSLLRLSFLPRVCSDDISFHRIPRTAYSDRLHEHVEYWVSCVARLFNGGITSLESLLTFSRPNLCCHHHLLSGLHYLLTPSLTIQTHTTTTTTENIKQKINKKNIKNNIKQKINKIKFKQLNWKTKQKKRLTGKHKHGHAFHKIN